MRSGLRSYGIATRKPRAGKHYKEFKFDAVLYGRLDGEFHWAVWDCKREKLLDPYRDKWGRQLNFECTSYIEIKAKRSNAPELEC
jgi:hypothetical protein